MVLFKFLLLRFDDVLDVLFFAFGLFDNGFCFLGAWLKPADDQGRLFLFDVLCLLLYLLQQIVLECLLKPFGHLLDIYIFLEAMVEFEARVSLEGF